MTKNHYELENLYNLVVASNSHVDPASGTPLTQENVNVIKDVYDKRIPTKRVNEAVKAGNLQTIKQHIDKFDYAKIQDAYVTACEKGYMNIVKYFVEERGQNPVLYGELHSHPNIEAACRGQQYEVLEYLKKKGLTPKQQTNTVNSTKGQPGVDASDSG